MPRKSPEGQPNLDFDQEPEPASILESPEFKKAKEIVETNAAIGQAEDKMRKTVYSMLSPEEKIEHDNLPTATEKREYIVRKYSKIFPPGEIK